MLSHPIDLSVDGLEVTPFLNSLKMDSTVYYNGYVMSDITCGESGDGQFIVMSGLLPLRYKTTVSSVKDNTLLALPRLLECQMGMSKSSIIIPTSPNMWEQNSMNDAYGIKQMFSLQDIQTAEHTSGINDSHIFDFAASKLRSDEEPFFHLTQIGC
jgi:lipoteichoic acid synthase